MFQIYNWFVNSRRSLRQKGIIPQKQNRRNVTMTSDKQAQIKASAKSETIEKASCINEPPKCTSSPKPTCHNTIIEPIWKGYVIPDETTVVNDGPIVELMEHFTCDAQMISTIKNTGHSSQQVNLGILGDRFQELPSSTFGKIFTTAPNPNTFMKAANSIDIADLHICGNKKSARSLIPQLSTCDVDMHYTTAPSLPTAEAAKFLPGVSSFYSHSPRSNMCLPQKEECVTNPLFMPSLCTATLNDSSFESAVKGFSPSCCGLAHKSTSYKSASSFSDIYDPPGVFNFLYPNVLDSPSVQCFMNTFSSSPVASQGSPNSLYGVPINSFGLSGIHPEIGYKTLSPEIPTKDNKSTCHDNTRTETIEKFWQNESYLDTLEHHKADKVEPYFTLQAPDFREAADTTDLLVNSHNQTCYELPCSYIENSQMILCFPTTRTTVTWSQAGWSPYPASQLSCSDTGSQVGSSYTCSHLNSSCTEHQIFLYNACSLLSSPDRSFQKDSNGLENRELSKDSETQQLRDIAAVALIELHNSQPG